jgi:hypothetical protein
VGGRKGERAPFSGVRSRRRQRLEIATTARPTVSVARLANICRGYHERSGPGEFEASLYRATLRSFPFSARRLAAYESPELLWIGCADSPVPANEIVGLLPG